MQQHADARTPGVLAQLLLFCQLLRALVHAGRLDRHGDQVRNGCDRRHGRNAEFHALTSCPAIPYAAAGANVREAALAIPPKCTYNRAIETRQGGIRMENTLKQKLAAGAQPIGTFLTPPA